MTALFDSECEGERHFYSFRSLRLKRDMFYTLFFVFLFLPARLPACGHSAPSGSSSLIWKSLV